jgi:hypothetical protein
MKPTAIPAAILAAILFTASITTQASTTGLVIGGLAAGAAAGLTNGNNTTKAAAALGGAVLGGLIGNAIEKKAQQRDYEAYTLGRYQEAYIQAHSNWYKATLDPMTGRPPAFDGYWAMDIGMPDQSQIKAMPTTRLVPTQRSDYESTLQTISQKTEGKTATPAATTITTTKRKVINGVEYSPQQVIYPRLPPKRA